MKIIEPNVELVDDFDAAAVMRKIERAGRPATVKRFAEQNSLVIRDGKIFRKEIST